MTGFWPPQAAGSWPSLFDAPPPPSTLTAHLSPGPSHNPSSGASNLFYLSLRSCHSLLTMQKRHQNLRRAGAPPWAAVCTSGKGGGAEHWPSHPRAAPDRCPPPASMGAEPGGGKEGRSEVSACRRNVLGIPTSAKHACPSVAVSSHTSSMAPPKHPVLHVSAHRGSWGCRRDFHVRGVHSEVQGWRTARPHDRHGQKSSLWQPSQRSRPVPVRLAP